MEYRNYVNSSFQTRVEKTYQNMLQNQTIQYLDEIKQKYNNFPNLYLDIWCVTDKLNHIVDESDPDSDLPQIVHAYQTAESIKNRYLTNDFILKENIEIKSLFNNDEWNNLSEVIKNKYSKYIHQFYSNILNFDWLYLVGFIHDLGKILLTKEFGNLKQWSVVGDTFPLGQKLDESYIFEKKNYHIKNKDLINNTYVDNCGFESLKMSWGHDEYLATILEKNNTKLPKEAIYIIRFHSFYSWHTPQNNQRGYTSLADDYDWYMLPLLKLFQKSDLYSKTRVIPSEEEIKKNFNNIVNKYLPEKILW